MNIFKNHKNEIPVIQKRKGRYRNILHSVFYILSITLITNIIILKELKAADDSCDIFIPGVRMKVNQKFGPHVYGATGIGMGYGQVGNVVYQDRSYTKLKIHALSKDSFMENQYVFYQARKVVGYFNFVGPQKIILKDGFEAEVLVLKECPHTHKIIKKKIREEKRSKEKQRKEMKKQASRKKKEQILKKNRKLKKNKNFESLYE